MALSHTVSENQNTWEVVQADWVLGMGCKGQVAGVDCTELGPAVACREPAAEEEENRGLHSSSEGEGPGLAWEKSVDVEPQEEAESSELEALENALQPAEEVECCCESVVHLHCPLQTGCH